MPIAFAKVTYHSRSKGHSAVAGIAYRAGKTLHDNRTGITHKYENRNDVLFDEILLPKNAEESFKDREYLWNTVEKAETRKNAQVARDVVLALPKELSLDEHINLAKQFAQTHFVSKGLVVDIAIHSHSKDNPHAHLYVTTRRLKGKRFSRLKARDLQPKVAKGFVVEDDAWGEQWRNFQNDYFKQHRINLVVDPNHLITRRHEGHIYSDEPHYLKEENKLRAEDSKIIALSDPESLLNTLTTRFGVFSENDVSRLVFKTLGETEGKAVFERIRATLLARPEVIAVGLGDDGRARYTTRAHFNLELDLMRDAETLVNRRQGRMSGRLIHRLSKQFSLSTEQTQALGYLVRDVGLRILVGRAGTGKSYLLKAANTAWVEKGYRVVGLSPSAVAAKGLMAASGIKSKTVAYYQKRWALGTLDWDKQTVVVMDEAGMTDSVAMQAMTQAASQTGAKLVLVGDDAQLQPVGKGAPLRALSEAYGFVALSSVRRQYDAGDKQASSALSQGNIAEAVTHYQQKQAIAYLPESKVFDTLLSDWQQGLSQQTLSERLIITHRNADVMRLNQAARALLIKRQLLDVTHQVAIERGGQVRSFALGERVVFLKNERELGVANGDKGRVVACLGRMLRVQLDGGVRIDVDTARYSDLDYGYASTVHKAQGVTVNRAYVLFNHPGWDRHLSYVALTRHRQALQVYVNRERAGDAATLIEQLSRRTLKDNVLDFPLFYAIRRGFEPEVLANRLISSLRRVQTVTNDVWTYLFRYTAFVQQRQHRARVIAVQAEREAQQPVAALAHSHQQLGATWGATFKRLSPALLVAQMQVMANPASDAGLIRLSQSVIQASHRAITQAPKMRDSLYALQSKRNRLGSGVFRHLSRYQRALPYYTINTADLARMHGAYRQQQAVVGFMKARLAGVMEYTQAYASFIIKDMKAHWPHVVQAAAQVNLSPQDLAHEITRAGRAHFYQTVYPTLSVEAQATIDKLQRLYQLDKKVSARWEMVMSRGGPRQLTAHQREYLFDLVAARNERALDYLANQAALEPWSWLYSFSESQVVRFKEYRLASLPARLHCKQWQAVAESAHGKGVCYRKPLRHAWPGLSQQAGSVRPTRRDKQRMKRRVLGLPAYRYYPPSLPAGSQQADAAAYAQSAYVLLKDMKAHLPHLAQAAKEANVSLSALMKSTTRAGRAHFYQTIYPTLSVEEKNQVKSLARLYRLDKQVSARWAEVMEQGGVDKLTAHQRAWLLERSAARDEHSLAYLMQQTSFEKWSELYSFGPQQMARFEKNRLGYERVRDYFSTGCVSDLCAEAIASDASHRKHVSRLSQVMSYQAGELGQALTLSGKATDAVLAPQGQVAPKPLSLEVTASQLRLPEVYVYPPVTLPARYHRHVKALSPALLTAITVRHTRRVGAVVPEDKAHREVWARLIRLESCLMQQQVLRAAMKSRMEEGISYTASMRLGLLTAGERGRWTALKSRIDSLGYALGGSKSVWASGWLSYFSVSQAAIMSAHRRESIRRSVKAFKALPVDSPAIIDYLRIFHHWECSRDKRFFHQVLMELKARKVLERCQATVVASVNASPEKTARVPTQSLGEPSAPFYTVDAVQSALMAESERFYSHYLGDAGRRVGGSLRYGKKGSLSVTTTGNNTGCWYSFETGEGGRPIDLLMNAEHGLGLSFKEALLEGARFAGIAPNHAPMVITPPKTSVSSALSEAEDKAKRIARARGYFEASQLIDGTLAERYLRGHRELTGDLSAFRFHPGVYDGEQKQSYPAVLVAARDVDGQVTAVQTILLDKETGQKADDVTVVKRTHGVVKGSVVAIHTGGGQQVVIAEGPETAASLIEALPEANIYVTLGNIKNAQHLGWLAKKHQTRAIHFAADNDGKNTQNLVAIDAVAEVLQVDGIGCQRSYPVIMGRDKCDFNDILKEQGVGAVRQQVAMWYQVIPCVPLPAEKPSLEKTQEKAWQSPELQDDWSTLVASNPSDKALESLCFWYQEWQKEGDPRKKARVEKSLTNCARKIGARKGVFEVLKSISPALAVCVTDMKRSHEKSHSRGR